MTKISLERTPDERSGIAPANRRSKQQLHEESPSRSNTDNSTVELIGSESKHAQPSTVNSFRLRVREIVKETEDSCSVVLERAREDIDPYRYRPGQFLTLRIPTPEGAVTRCYSLCSSPDAREPMRIGVKAVPGGLASNWINQQLRVGDEIESLPPAGNFWPRSFSHPLTLFAGGSGVTPMLSIAKSAIIQGCPDILLVFANRDRESVMFRSALSELAAENRSLTVIHWFDQERGFMSEADIREMAGTRTESDVYVCGPEPFMNMVSDSLAAMGLPKRRIHLERFKSLDGDPFTVAREAATVDDTAATARVKVSLYDAVHELDWPRSQTLLALLEEAGLAPPFSCREGRCSACACVLRSGKVSMMRNDALEPEDLEDGLILSCQALPITDEIQIEYP